MKQQVEIKVRNWHALNAIQMSKQKSGPTKNRKKEANRKACRGKFKED